MAVRRIHSVEVSGLQNSYNYKITFPVQGNNIILIAPNGFGKTAFLALIQAALGFDIKAMNAMKFDVFKVVFVDGRRWEFTKTDGLNEYNLSIQQELNLGPELSKPGRKGSSYVHAKIFDPDGKEHDYTELDLSNVEANILLRALSRSRAMGGKISQQIAVSPNVSTLTLQETIRQYGSVLSQDPIFRGYIEKYYPDSFKRKERSKRCVFIETQRLLSQKSQNADAGEEIAKQALKLSAILRMTYDNYASTSQGLDRSFPNRLIARARNPGTVDVLSLRADLDAIERRRESLTEAGILVEQAKHVVPPSDEYIQTVSDALQIYVEDSKKKLATFDGVYPQVSALREIINNKLRPKELSINRQRGAEIVKGSLRLPLENLSSGEKHVFVMLFRLIFETPKNSVVLIDEPEISLHVLWQLEFMRDLLKIQDTNPFQAIIATHSPQIFQGMESLVVDLADQV